MTVGLLRPDGETGDPSRSLAPSLDVLTGVRVGVLDNTKPNADVILDRIAGRLAERTGAHIRRRDTKNAAMPAGDQVLDGMQNEVRIVLTGSAD